MPRLSSPPPPPIWIDGTGARPPRLSRAVAARLRGPGGCYNLGNALALTAGLAAQVAGSAGAGQGVLAAVQAYFVGSPGASALTVAILIFFWSGEMYHRAWAHGAPPEPRANWWGDMLSGVAAVVLTIALVAFGDVLLALLSGALLAAGKFGSAVAPGSPRLRAFWRWLVLASRVPALATLGLQVVRLAGEGAGAGALFMPLVMIGCYLTWACADLMLFAGDSAGDPAGDSAGKPAGEPDR